MSVAVPTRRRAGLPARSRPAVETPPPAAAPRRRVRPRTSRLRAGGVAWLVVVAALLGGIVTVQVAALRANIELGRLNDQAAQLRTENQNAAAEIAVLENGARIERFARKRGMTLVVPAAGDVLTLAAPHRRAAARHHAASGPPPSRGRRPPR